MKRVRPIEGQPGLFRLTPDGLSAARYGGTTTFVRTRRSAGLHDLAATRYGGTSTFVRTRRASGLDALPLPDTYVKKSRSERVSQEDVPTGKVPGLDFTFWMFGQASQDQLDRQFRSLFAQQGYDVSSSNLSADPLTWVWRYDAPTQTYEAFVEKGPPAWVGRSIGILYAGQTPTSKDLDDAPKQVSTYTLTVRPKDGVLSTQKLDAVLAAVRGVKHNIPGKTEVGLRVKGVTAPRLDPQPVPQTESANWALWLVLGLAGSTGAWLYSRKKRT